MNCFAHALPHLENPYMAVGVCLPDWLSAFDRKCRVREKQALPFIDHRDQVVATTAVGVVRHHRDDDWFHRTPKFNELILHFAVELRDLLGNELSMRPSFVGHVVVEMFLDACLSQRNPGKLELFYRQVQQVDGAAIQTAINRFANRPTDKLVAAIERFCQSRFLFDYDTDQGIVYRMNQVLRRVHLAPLDDRVLQWLPGARQRVYNHASDLLPNYPIEV